MFETIGNFLADIFVRIPLAEMNGFQLAFLVLLSIAGVWLARKVLKYTKIAIVAVTTAIKNTLSAKERCKKIQCVHCGRTLDRCTCAKNKGKSAVSRLILYKKEHKR